MFLFSSFLKKKQNFLIVHSSDVVQIFQESIDQYNVISVPKIENNAISVTVGAGDAFNAGLLLDFANKFEIQSAVERGIEVAQKYITGTIK